MLTGIKTYILAALVALAAIIALFNGSIGLFVVGQTFAGAMTLASVRAAIKKLEVAAQVIPETYWSRMGGFIPGTKTYLSSAIVAGFAFAAWLFGEQSTILSAIIILTAIGIGTLRLAISRVQRKISRLR